MGLGEPEPHSGGGIQVLTCYMHSSNESESACFAGNAGPARPPGTYHISIRRRGAPEILTMETASVTPTDSLII